MIRVGQMVEHACADDLVERSAELPDLFDRKPMEIEVAQAVFSLKVARVAKTGFADVDSRHLRVGLAHRMGRGLRSPAAGDKNLPLCPRLLSRPKQKGQRAPPLRIAVELAMLIEALERGRIGMA